MAKIVRQNQFLDDLRNTYLNKSLENRQRDSYNWYRNRISTLVNIDIHKDILNDTSRQRLRTIYGGMFLYRYEPKLKKELKYYDKYPLIFLIEQYNNGFLGINMHYLSLEYRSILFHHMKDLAFQNNRFNHNTRLKVNYNILNSIKKYKYFRPCIKRYLTKNIKSRIVKIPSAEWELALYLPIERFKKETKEVIWIDSENIIRDKG